MPIIIPGGVTVEIKSTEVKALGPKGELSEKLPPETQAEIKEGKIIVSVKDTSRQSRAMHGLARSLLANLVEGVSQGYSKTLELSGIGFRSSLSGKKLVLNIGFSHPVEVEPPEGIEFRIRDNKITVLGINKQLVGETAARIYRIRPPEPYKGKGIRYSGQVIRRKAGKAAKAITTK